MALVVMGFKEVTIMHNNTLIVLGLITGLISTTPNSEVFQGLQALNIFLTMKICTYIHDQNQAFYILKRSCTVQLGISVLKNEKVAPKRSIWDHALIHFKQAD